jgi:hypothetical protein
VSSASAMGRIATIVVTLLLVLPAMAMASGETVLQDCADDSELSRTYSQAEYKKALANIPADLDEYTDCRSIIRAAQLKHASKSGSPKGGSGSSKPKLSKSKRKKLKQKLEQASDATQPLKIGNSVVKPGNLESSAGVPAPLIVVLVLTLLGALTAGGLALRKIVLDRRDQ